MRDAWIKSPVALRERMVVPQQVAPTEPEAEMPPYMESFLAHLRLLVGVPFDYLVPDERLLPDESIRFFYLDRSWTDRLVDGAIAVGKIGTREQAHHQAHAPTVNQQLDQSERIVRSLQRGKSNFATLKLNNDHSPSGADLITGFLLRSQAVSGWPGADVRAYSRDTQELKEPMDPSDPKVQQFQLKTLRLERLAPSVLIALFQGVPQLVTIEEPHHGVQFGIHVNGTNNVFVRQPNGFQVLDGGNPVNIRVPVRASNNRVVHVAELRRRLYTAQATYPTAVQQTGSAAFAISVLNPPWRQRFEGSEDKAGTQDLSGGFVYHLGVGQRVLSGKTFEALESVVVAHGGK
jgi:hypothetical protein